MVKRKLLSDDGKSMAVLYLDKFSIDLIAYLDQNRNAISDLESKLSGD
ncbi:hypothetical protein [Candidatus Nitrosotalea okcheonensis]|uniref:Uncharacterized protein n=1 Tax=Candidatus Nitrosotalea okcheonensis TaxID=1903276 RepID=A0A2H1FHE1_9ARCH|nr:hypothetical protein [Candidatus Nitrosotalea okcheonensis]SMH72185.1 protein of unknown function [Candidatus Nitrosotalea okcheonensis]